MANCRLGALSAAVRAWDLLKEVTINLNIDLPEITQDWENRLLEGTKKKPCVHQDPRKRSSDLTRD